MVGKRTHKTTWMRLSAHHLDTGQGQGGLSPVWNIMQLFRKCPLCGSVGWGALCLTPKGWGFKK